MRDRGMSERYALRVVGMSASALRYVPRRDGNVELRRQIVELAQRHPFESEILRLPEGARPLAPCAQK